MQKLISVAISCSVLFVSQKAFSLPIDWKGVFTADTLLIDQYRRVEGNNNTNSDSNQVISQATGGEDNASLQNYKLRLNPTIIVNDGASLHGEITSGYAYGGQFGDSSQTGYRDSTFSNALYFYNTSDSDSNLILRKFYLELFSDTGNYYIGRQSHDWGLGLVYDSGDNILDRHATIRDGLKAVYNIGFFSLSPYYYKIDLSNDGLTKENNAKEYGIDLLYDNPERELQFGIVFGKKNSKTSNTFYKSDINAPAGTPRSLGETDVKIIDLFIAKQFGDFHVAFEGAFLDGDIGAVYTSGQNAKYKAKAMIAETKYKLNDNWNFGFDLGYVPGDDGNISSFDAMYLHPNYQIANLMFRYNMQAVANPSTQSIYDSSITNATFFKLYAKWDGGTWTWTVAAIYATADETASNGKQAFNHTKNEVFTANANQADDYGFELDVNFDYRWNDNITIQGALGYHFVGDYYAYEDSTTNLNTTKNSYAALLGAAVTF